MAKKKQRFANRPAANAGLGPDLPELQQARALWQRHAYNEALQLFDKAVTTHPNNVMALLDASRAWGARFETQKAEDLLHRLVSLPSNNPEILHLAGQSYRMIHRPNQAMECFQRVLQKCSDIPDAYLELAVLYERRHRVAEALHLVEQCTSQFPDYHEARLLVARLLQRSNQSERACALLRGLTQKMSIHPLVQAQAWADLAQFHDSQGAYPAAMDNMLRCKTILLKMDQTFLHESTTVLRHLQQLADSIQTTDYARWKSESVQLPPHSTAVLTSFPRSGTTLLEQILDSHSGLISSDERETFARDIFPEMWMTPTQRFPTREAINALPPERLEQLRNRYWKSMEAALNEPIGSRVHLDKNPTLTLVLPGFLRLFPETKILFALRDPRDVVISCFMQYLPLNANSVCFLTLERTARRLAADLGVWLQIRNRIASRWMELRYEDTVKDVTQQTRTTLDFLGLPWEDSVLHYRERLQSKSVGSPTYQAVTKPIYSTSIGRWKHYESFLAPHLPILEPILKAWNYT